MSQYYDRYWQELDSEKLGDFDYKWPEIKQFVQTKKNLKILDFGCGAGIMLMAINELNPSAHLFGVDVSSLALKKATKNLPVAKFKAITDGQKLPFPTATFDFIMCADVIEHTYNTEETLAEISRVLKPNGQLLISAPYHGWFKNLIISLFFFDQYFDVYGPHIRFFSLASLAQKLRSVNLNPIHQGTYGRFFPLSRGMYILAQKLSLHR